MTIAYSGGGSHDPAAPLAPVEAVVPCPPRGLDGDAICDPDGPSTRPRGAALDPAPNPPVLGELPCLKEEDTAEPASSVAASDEYLQNMYLFKSFKAVTMDTISSCGASVAPGAAQSANSLDSFASTLEDADDVVVSNKSHQKPPQKALVPPPWGMHALFALGYTMKEIIGSTTESVVVVRRCESGPEGQSVAVKCLSTRNQEYRDSMQKEYDILSQMSHRSIVKATALHQSRFDMWLCMEFCHDTVEAHVNRHGPVRQDSKDARWLRELAEGVDYLHSLGGVAHGDLRPQSLLLRQTEAGHQLKIAGFSRACPLAGRLPLGARANLGVYSAPEVWLNHMGMEEPADVWSLGMCMCFMLFGEQGLPVRLTDSVAISSFLMLGLPDRRWTLVGLGLEQLLRQCLAPQPNCRPDASDLLAGTALPGEASPPRPAVR